MEINYLKINGFGNIENKEIEFGENINLIFGNNESGKSTLLKFITAMFYGLSKNKNGKDISDMEKYRPWGNAEFSGKMVYTLDNNNRLEVFRDFTKKNPKISNEAGEDILKNFNMDKNKGSEFFYEQTNIDEEMFLATGLVEQQNVVLKDKEKSILTQKIANLLTSGEENLSYKKAIEKLNKDLIEKIGTDRTVGRPLNIVNEKIREIIAKKQEFTNKEQRKEEIIEEQKALENGIELYNQKRKELQDIKQISDKHKIEQEKINYKIQMKREKEDRIEQIKKQLKNKRTLISKQNIYITIFLLIMNIINLFLLKNKFLPFSFLILIPLVVISVLKQKNEKNFIIKQLNILKVEKENLEQEIQNEKGKLEEEKADIVKKYEFPIDDISNVSAYLDELNNKINDKKIRLNMLKIEEKNIIKDLEEKAELEEKFRNSENEKENLQKEEKRIKLTKELLEKAYNKMKSKITPKLTKILSETAEQISNKRYKNIKFNDEVGLLVELPNGEYVNSNRLSTGTIEQMYLSLRLSVFKEVTNEKIPIILDEAFAYYDEERLKNTLEYLNKEFKENQIIIFTCSDREKNILDKSKIKYNLIKI